MKVNEIEPNRLYALRRGGMILTVDNWAELTVHETPPWSGARGTNFVRGHHLCYSAERGTWEASTSWQSFPVRDVDSVLPDLTVDEYNARRKREQAEHEIRNAERIAEREAASEKQRNLLAYLNGLGYESAEATIGRTAIRMSVDDMADLISALG